MPKTTGRAHGRANDDACARCDEFLGLEGVHVEHVERGRDALTVRVSTAWELMGCPVCGVVAPSRGRRLRVLRDVPYDRPVRVLWRQKTWACPDQGCPVGLFVEQLPALVAPRASVTRRAVDWAITQLRRENATIAGLARQIGTSWPALWRQVRPRLEALAGDESRFEGIEAIGVDEHIWHHVSTKPVEAGGQGPKELTGMVDLTRDDDGKVHARLLDLAPGRSGKVLGDWLDERGAHFKAGVKIAALDPFAGYKRALDDKLADAIAVLDAFHVVALGTKALDECRRRVQQATLGHRGRKGDPLHGIARILRAGAENLTSRQWNRLHAAFEADPAHEEVFVAWQATQQLRAAYHAPDLTDGHAIAAKAIAAFPSCPIPEIARLGRTLRQWKDAFLAYFTTGRVNNGPTEALNGIIELQRRLARGFRNRDNYRLRMLLAGGGLD